MSSPLNSRDIYYKYLVVLLLSSPALSFIGLFSGVFFPNEKIALLMTVLKPYTWRNSYQNFRLLGVGVALVAFVLFGVQHTLGINALSITSINAVLVIASIPLYAAYFSKCSYTTYKVVFHVAVFQLILSLIQQVAMQLGFLDIISYFNNYPPQKGYTYPLGEMGYFYRTSGLLNESSSYALFQSLGIISAINIGINKKLFGKFLLGALVLDLLINGSILGYLFFISYLIFSGRIKMLLLVGCTMLFLYMAVNVLFDLRYSPEGLINKISSQFESVSENSDESTRLSTGINNINSALRENVWYGSGFSWEGDGWDFISVYLKALGILGFFVLSIYVSCFLSQAPPYFAVAALGVLLINGHLSTSVNILLLCFCCLLPITKRSTFYLKQLV